MFIYLSMNLTRTKQYLPHSYLVKGLKGSIVNRSWHTVYEG